MWLFYFRKENPNKNPIEATFELEKNEELKFFKIIYILKSPNDRKLEQRLDCYLSSQLLCHTMGPKGVCIYKTTLHTVNHYLSMVTLVDII